MGQLRRSFPSKKLPSLRSGHGLQIRHQHFHTFSKQLFPDRMFLFFKMFFQHSIAPLVIVLVELRPELATLFPPLAGAAAKTELYGHQDYCLHMNAYMPFQGLRRKARNVFLDFLSVSGRAG